MIKRRLLFHRFLFYVWINDSRTCTQFSKVLGISTLSVRRNRIRNEAMRRYLSQLVDCERAQFTKAPIERAIKQICHFNVLLAALVAELHLGLEEFEALQASFHFICLLVAQLALEHVEQAHEREVVLDHQVDCRTVCHD